MNFCFVLNLFYFKYILYTSLTARISNFEKTNTWKKIDFPKVENFKLVKSVTKMSAKSVQPFGQL